LLLNETINAKWIFGVILVVIGSYLLNQNTEDDEKEKSKVE
jgi:drug/metabolite transporter (DMT)-like permease